MKKATTEVSLDSTLVHELEDYAWEHKRRLPVLTTATTSRDKTFLHFTAKPVSWRFDRRASDHSIGIGAEED